MTYCMIYHVISFTTQAVVAKIPSGLSKPKFCSPIDSEGIEECQPWLRWKCRGGAWLRDR